MSYDMCIDKLKLYVNEFYPELTFEIEEIGTIDHFRIEQKILKVRPISQEIFEDIKRKQKEIEEDFKTILIINSQITESWDDENCNIIWSIRDEYEKHIGKTGRKPKKIIITYEEFLCIQRNLIFNQMLNVSNFQFTLDNIKEILNRNKMNFDEIVVLYY